MIRDLIVEPSNALKITYLSYYVSRTCNETSFCRTYSQHRLNKKVDCWVTITCFVTKRSSIVRNPTIYDNNVFVLRSIEVERRS